jgi:hypothetical protein
VISTVCNGLETGAGNGPQARQGKNRRSADQIAMVE